VAALDDMHLSTFYARTAKGYTVEQALTMPKYVRKWQFELEAKEGQTLLEIVRREFAAGVSLHAIERSFGLKRDTLYYRVKRWKEQGLL